jgi:hypothetical protein
MFMVLVCDKNQVSTHAGLVDDMSADCSGTLYRAVRHPLPSRDKSNDDLP